MNLDRSARPILFTSPFFRRLFLPYLILMWLGIGAAGIFGAAHLRNSYLESTTQALATEARLVADLIDEHLQRSQIPELRQQINRLGGMTGRRLTIIAADGKVIDSHKSTIDIRAQNTPLGDDHFRTLFELDGVGKVEADLHSGRFLRANARFCSLARRPCLA